MTRRTTLKLGVLDYGTVRDGQSRSEALDELFRLAQHADNLGYERYWVAEHHATADNVSTSPHVLIPYLLERTDRIRIGSAATVLANYSTLQAAEEAATIAYAARGRFDLGIARYRYPLESNRTDVPDIPDHIEDTWVDGVLLPASQRPDVGAIKNYLDLQDTLLGPVRKQFGDYDTRAADLLALLFGGYQQGEHTPEALISDPDRAAIQFWLHGQNPHGAGLLAASLGARLSTRYLVNGHKIVPTIEIYRDNFQPSALLAQPYVSVAASVLVIDEHDGDFEREVKLERYAEIFVAQRKAEHTATARHLSRATAEQVVRSGFAPQPSPPDKVRIVDTYDNVLIRLRALAEYTTADELVIHVHSVEPERRFRTLSALVDLH